MRWMLAMAASLTLAGCDGLTGPSLAARLKRCRGAFPAARPTVTGAAG